MEYLPWLRKVLFLYLSLNIALPRKQAFLALIVILLGCAMIAGAQLHELGSHVTDSHDFVSNVWFTLVLSQPKFVNVGDKYCAEKECQ